MTNVPDKTSPPAAKPQRLLTFASGGWILLLAGLCCVLAVVEILHQSGLAGGATAFNGFDLLHCNVPRRLIAVAMPKDFLKLKVDPKMLTAPEADEKNKHEYYKFLVGRDRVIGMQIGTDVRAYPLRLLNWNEVVNDDLGASPIAVTYNPLCDSAAVFDRRVNGQTLAFGVSGLVYDSNLLMYDRQTDSAAAETMNRESLWAQLSCKAVSGPLAGTSLAVLHCTVTTWNDWKRQHPDTLVMDADVRLREEYPNDTYGTYFETDEIKYPVEPMWKDAVQPAKTPTIALENGGVWSTFAFPVLAARAQNGLAVVPVKVGEKSITLVYHAESQTVDAADPAVPVIYSFAFAWYAQHAPIEMPRDGAIER